MNLKVVLDTNCMISAILWQRGRLSPLREAWQHKEFVLLMSKYTFAELMRVQGYAKFKLTDEARAEIFDAFYPWAEIIKLSPRTASFPDLRDPKDACFLQLAEQAKADYMVSGDRHLLDLAGKISVPIITPAKFLEVLGK